MALTKTQVSELYVAIFNRASEQEGNNHWQGAESATQAANDMLATDAAKQYFGTSLDSNQAFIEHIYFNTLDKTYADDAEGIDFWVSALDAGTSRGEIVASLVAAIAGAEDGPAKQQFENRVEVSNYVADNLEGAPDNYMQALGFSGDLTVTSNPDTINSAKKAVQELAVETGETSTLTEALEALQKAEADKAEFLKAEAAADEDLFAAALALTKASDATAEKPATSDIATAVGNAATTALTALNTALGSTGNIGDTSTEAYIESIITEAKTKAAAAVTKEQDAIKDIAGLESAIKALASAQESEKEAAGVFDDTKADYTDPVTATAAALANFDALNGGVTTSTGVYGAVSFTAATGAANYTAATYDLEDGIVKPTAPATSTVLVNDGTAAAVIEINAQGNIVVADGYKNHKGVNELLAAVKAEIQATLELLAAQQEIVDQTAEIVALENAFVIDAFADVTVTDANGLSTFTGTKLYQDSKGNLLVGNATDDEFYEVSSFEVTVANGAIAVAAAAVINIDSTVATTITTKPSTYTEVDASNPLKVTGEHIVSVDSIPLSATKADKLITALAAEKQLLDEIKAYEDTKAPADALKGHNDSIDAIKKALSDAEKDGGFGINLLEDDKFTLEDDVYVFDAEDAPTAAMTNFGNKSKDMIFFGNKYTFVALEEGKTIDDKVGDASVLEMFWEETASGLNLYIEQEAFAGNVSGQGDIVTVTLTGVSFDDVTFEGGYLIAGA